jgi:hypothetical protein
VLFPTHLLIGGLLAVILGFDPVPAVVGAAALDLIDKPLPRTGLVDTPHSMAHSGLAAAVVTTGGALFPPLSAFALGWVSHTLMDIAHMLLNGRTGHWRFVLWPFDFADDPMTKPPLEFFRHYIGTRSFYFEVAVWVSSVAWFGLTQLSG